MPRVLCVECHQRVACGRSIVLRDGRRVCCECHGMGPYCLPGEHDEPTCRAEADRPQIVQAAGTLAALE